MLASFRQLAGTWPARIFFIVLGASFMSWGVADVVTRVATGSGNVAVVDGRAITPAEFAADFRQNLRRVAERMPDPNALPPELRQQVAQQTLQRLVTQQAVASEMARLDIAAPDAAVREAVFAIPSFQGADGKFQRGIFLNVLQNNNMNESHFLDLMREETARNQLINTVAASAGASPMLASMIYGYMNEKRTADLLLLPFDGRPVPSPDEAVLKRFYTNNPARYTAPEYRHIKAVILSPTTIGRSLPVSDADLRTWFDAHRSEFVSQEKRSLQVITTASQSVADALAAKWRGGADWVDMQAEAKKAGATAVPLDDAVRAAIPSPELAKAAFAAQQNVVTGPIKEPLGIQLMRVVAITPAKNPSFDQLKPVIHDRAAAEKAADLIDARAQKLQDLFAGGAKIDEVPSDLGAAGASGMLDAQGKTRTGEAAPIPVDAKIRQQIVDAAFKTSPTDPIQTVEGPDHVWYAVAVDAIEKPALSPYDTVRTRVLADWRADQIRHQQEAEASRILALVRGGQTLKAAAWGSGLQVTRSDPQSRNRPTGGVPAELSRTLFTLKPGEATMVETNKGFVVGALADVIKADPKGDEAGLSQAREGIVRALREDMIGLYADSLRDKAKPKIFPRVIAGLIQQPGE